MARKISLWIKITFTCALLFLFLVLIGRFVFSFNKDLSVLNKRQTSLNKEVRESKYKASLLEQEKAVLAKENQQLMDNFDLLTGSYEGLDLKNRDLTADLAELEDQIDLVIQANEALIEERDAAKLELGDYAEEVGGIDNKYLELESKCVTLEREKLALEREYNDLTRQVTYYQGQSQALKKEEDKYRPKIEALKKKIKELAAEKKSMTLEVKQSVKQVSKYEEQAEYHQKQYEKTLGLLEKQMQRWGAIEENYARLLKENRELKGKTRDIPRKLEELHRLNNEILKEKSLLHYNLGVFYTQKEDYEKAIREFREVLKVNANDPEAHYNLGVIYSEYILDRDKAVAHFKKYLGLAPRDEDSDRARRYLMLQATVGGY